MNWVFGCLNQYLQSAPGDGGIENLQRNAMLLAWQTESSNFNRDAIALVDFVITNVPMIFFFLYMHSYFFCSLILLAFLINTQIPLG